MKKLVLIGLFCAAFTPLWSATQPFDAATFDIAAFEQEVFDDAQTLHNNVSAFIKKLTFLRAHHALQRHCNEVLTEIAGLNGDDLRERLRKLQQHQTDLAALPAGR